MAETAKTTRYERVIQMLDRAAGKSAVDYDGKGRFWRLPLEQFASVEVYGVRMIAPVKEAEGHSCCAGETLAEAGSETGRGARSGLIMGLRGEAPFDGTQFPRLPWGGHLVPEDEINFIADWIDDGLPASDHQTTFTLDGSATEPHLATVEAGNIEEAATAFAVYEGSPGEYSYMYGELKQRMNLDCMQETQREKLRWAFRELYRFDKWPEDRRSYNNQALIHQNHCQHGWERFLPWHRVYLYEFEQTLQDVCPDVTLPYWDWTMPQYMPERPEKGSIIPNSFKTYLTKESITYLVEKADPALPPEAGAALLEQMVNKGLRYTSSTTFFEAVANITNKEFTKAEHRDRFIDALLAANSFWYPLRYPAEYHDSGGKPQEITQAIHYHYPTAEDMQQILSLRTFRDFGGGSFYDAAFGFLDQNPHNTMHIWTGGMNPHPAKAEPEISGDLGRNRNRGVRVQGRRFHSREDLYSMPEFGDMFSNLTASYDPIFWPIHANVDRIWHEWQELNPHSLPQELDAVLTPWSYTIADTLNMSRFGYEYVKSTYIVPVGLETPVGRFVSRPIELPEAVRAGFQQVEVRLHRVPQLPRSCFIRVFLNLQDANASTSIEDTHYAGYLAVFGHGPCVGGPGHCDVPPIRPRQYDQRQRNHNTPRNHRINVTTAAKRLIEGGASSLTITLVVIGADYREERDLLRLGGVSLDFLD
jgi:tyrosinase